MSAQSPIDPQQSFVPVITGGDLGAYSLAREYHELFGYRSAVVPTTHNLVVGGSQITTLFPAGPMFDGETVVSHLERVATEVNAQTPQRPLVLHLGYDHLVRIAADYDARLRAAGYVFPQLTVDQLDAAALKDRFYQTCEDLNIAYPRTAIFDASHDTPDQFVAQLTDKGFAFPLVLKADDGAEWANTRFEGRRKVHFFPTEDARPELTRVLTAASAAGYSGKLIVQEFIPGPDSQLRILTVYRNGAGQVTLAGEAEVIVEDHASGLEGNSRAVLSSRDEKTINAGIAIANTLDWHGYAMYDIKVHPETGQPYFLEMNPRLGRHHYYLTATGHNPVRTYLQDLLPEALHGVTAPGAGGGEEPVIAYQENVMSTTIPLSVARRYANEDQKRRLDAAKKAKKVFTPLEYSADKNFKRDLYQKYRLVKAAEEVQHTPGTMN